MDFSKRAVSEKCLLLAVAGICWVSGRAYGTTPVVSSLSATSQVQGNIVTVTGSHMMDTDLSGLRIPPNQASFEGSSFTADGWTDANAGDKNAIDASVKIVGNQSYRNHIYSFQTEVGMPDPCPNYYYGGYLERLYPNESWNVVYFRYYVRYSNGFVWPNNYMKQLYMREGWCMNPEMGLPSYKISQPNEPAVFTFPRPLVNGRWYCLEGRFHFDGSPGELWLDGQSMGTGSPGPGSKPWYGFMLGTVNSGCFSGSPQASSYIWFDDFNFSNTRRVRPEALVYLADGMNFATAKKVSQELISISDNSIQFKTNYGGIGYGPFFLFVVNNRNEVSTPYSAGTGKQTDFTPPAVSNMTPASGQAGLPPFISIKLSLTDLESGMDLSSISMKVNGQSVKPSTVVISNGYSLTYKPTVYFDSGSTVAVVVNAKDLAGNAMPALSYSFTIRGTVGIWDRSRASGLNSNFLVKVGPEFVRFSFPSWGNGAGVFTVQDLLGREIWRSAIPAKGNQVNWPYGDQVKEGVYVAKLQQGPRFVFERFSFVK